MSIDEKIEEILQRLDNRESTHQDYLSPELKRIQARVLATHAHLEASLENRIFIQVARDEQKLNPQRSWQNISTSVATVVSYLSWRDKVRTVKVFGDGLPTGNLDKVNELRNKFAHPKGRDLRDQYNESTLVGKENIFALLKVLDDGMQAMDDYLIEALPDILEKTDD